VAPSFQHSTPDDRVRRSHLLVLNDPGPGDSASAPTSSHLSLPPAIGWQSDSLRTQPVVKKVLAAVVSGVCLSSLGPSPQVTDNCAPQSSDPLGAMWLINVATLVLETHYGMAIPPCAILNVAHVGSRRDVIPGLVRASERARALAPTAQTSSTARQGTVKAQCFSHPREPVTLGSICLILCS